MISDVLTPVERSARGVRMIDQRKLPLVEVWNDYETPEEVARAITDMVVRGAPAIGVSAAFGLALGATRAAALAPDAFDRRMDELHRLMLDARPTAVNLRWAAERLRETARRARVEGLDNAGVAARLEEEARKIHAEDLAACREMGRHGARARRSACWPTRHGPSCRGPG
jgi:methylthioribose-1-phosphate isomerase